MTLELLSFIIGAILLAVGVLGGGIEVKEIKIPKVTPLVRILSGCIGLVFILLGLSIAEIMPWPMGRKPPPPDLIIESLTHSPETPTTRDTITFTSVVKNIGLGQAGPSTLALKVGGETSPKTFRIPALGPGEAHTVERPLTLSVAQADYTTATADLEDQVDESDETNNQKKDAYQVILPVPPKDIIPPERVLRYEPRKPNESDKIAFNVTASDEGSGIDRIEIFLRRKDTWESIAAVQRETWEGLLGPFPPGKIAFNAIAYDKAGNQYPGDKSQYEEYITIEKKDTAPVSVPEVRGLMLESARKTLEREGFRVGRIWAADTEEPFNTVVSSSPAAGARIDPGSFVDLTVSWTRGQAERLVVQNWINAANDKDQSRLVELSAVPFSAYFTGRLRFAQSAKDLRDVAIKILLDDYWSWNRYRGVVPVIYTREVAPANMQKLYPSVARQDDHLAVLGSGVVLIVRQTGKMEVRVVGLHDFRPACFVSGTSVETPNGLLAIEYIRPGDIVFAFDTENSVWAVDNVAAVLSHVAVGDFVQIGITGGVTFKATGSHPIWVRHGSGLRCRPAAADVLENESVMTKTGRWVEARDLKRGDVLAGRSGPAFVETIGKTFGAHQVHTILLERYRGYAVSRAGIAVHMEEIHRPRQVLSAAVPMDALNNCK